MTAMLAPQINPTTPDPYATVRETMRDITTLEEKIRRLRCLRDAEVRRLHGSGVSVTALRDQTGLSKSMIRLIVGSSSPTPVD